MLNIFSQVIALKNLAKTIFEILSKVLFNDSKDTVKLLNFQKFKIFIQ